MTHSRDSIALTSDSLVLRFLSESGIPISDNNKVRLLKSGREKFIDLFSAIRDAKHHIHLEYFNFRNDSIANALFDLLAEKVKEGVEVRAMFDAFGNWSNNKPLKKRHLKKIREQGIEIVKFDPFTFPYINHAAHRDHRKIAVIDGEVAYTGGMNIADYYINGLPKIGTWRDMHMRIEGDAVNDLQEIFLTIWNKETKQNIGGEAYFPKHKEQSDTTNIVVAIVDRTPKKNSRMLSHAYAMSIYSAQKNVHIVNPYFVPTSSINKALQRTIERGVDVTIMVSSVYSGRRPLQTSQTDEKGSHRLYVQWRFPSFQNHDGRRYFLHGRHRKPEQPQPPIRLRDERFHLQQGNYRRTERNVSERYRALYAADTGILEKALTVEEVRRMVCQFIHAIFVILHRTNLLENYSL
jgi:cardiolipin synthase